MKTTKKLLIVGLAGILAAVSFIPSTFSWYTHNAVVEGKRLSYTKNDLPVSAKSSNDTLVFTTMACDSKGVTSGSVLSSISLPANTTGDAVQYYKTVITNNGVNDVYVDIEAKNLANNADFLIGTISPTLNEKAFASRATRSKVSNNETRVYFRTNNDYKSFWGKYYDGDNDYIGDNGLVDFSDTSNVKNDFNIAYKISGAASETFAKLKRCDDTAYSEDDPAAAVFYYDVPSNAEYFYFCNHWYFKSSTNREWNRTIDITDMTAGRLYRLTGKQVDYKWKEYAAEPVDTGLVALNQYYNTVRMSNGSSVYADISLKKDSTDDDEDFVPEYYGQSISYSSADTSVATVNGDGLITPTPPAEGAEDTARSTTITTTIKGKYGDEKQVQTVVTIPAAIPQVPIIKNVMVPKANVEEGTNSSVEILWYALNRGVSTDQLTAPSMTADIFYTL